MEMLGTGTLLSERGHMENPLPIRPREIKIIVAKQKSLEGGFFISQIGMNFNVRMHMDIYTHMYTHMNTTKTTTTKKILRYSLHLIFRRLATLLR